MSCWLEKLGTVSLISLFAISLSFPTLASALDGGHEGGNGSNSFEFGGATKLFDVIEYSEALIPGKTGEPWRLVDKQLRALATKLPFTAKYLRSFYEDGKTLWWFVDVKLKDTKDAGSTNLVLTFQREQMAANLNGKIQIRKDLWQKLDDENRATLLLHEMLWSAIGPQYLKDGSPIRFLSRFLLHPDLEHFSPENIRGWFKREIGDPRSPILQWLEYDDKMANEGRNFRVERISDPPRTDAVVEVVGFSKILGMQITAPRPNPRYPEVNARDYGPRAGTDSGFSGGGLELLEITDLCGSLDYGRRQGWRLPTEDEVVELRKLGLYSLSVQNGEIFRDSFSAIRKPGTTVKHQALLALTYSGSLMCIDSKVRGLNRDCQWVMDQTFYQATDIGYFCVHR